MSSSPKIALVTGGAGGMGYAMAMRLVELGWNVAIVDYNEEAGKAAEQALGQQVIFLRADVADYDQQAAAFTQTWDKWGRIDLVWANAGIGDQADFTAPVGAEGNGAPAKPDVKVVDIVLYGPIYTSYLAMFFFRKNVTKGGMLIITSSMAGLYPQIALPLYGAAKHGSVGLTRNLAMILGAKGEPIKVNCLCPGLVPTGIISKELLEAFPKERITPLSAIVRAVETLINDDVSGKVVECSGSSVHYRDPPEFLDDDAVYLNETFTTSVTLQAASKVGVDAEEAGTQNA